MASSPATYDSSHEFVWAPSPSPTTPTSTQELAPAKIYRNLSPPLIAMVAVIGTAFLIVLYARILSQHIRRLRRRWRRYRRLRRLLRSTFSGDLGSPPPNSNAFSLDPSSADYFFSPYGLDESAIKSLPLSIFTLKKSTLTRDCAVCLLEFEDGDSLRTLPLCSHAFHVDCIDVWLRSHATCPLCRAGVFRQDPLFIPMRAARIRPSLDDLIFDPPPEPMPEPEIGPAVASPPADRNFLLKRSYSFGFERNLAADRMVMDASTASPWRYRHRGSSFWSKRWPSPFTGSSSASRASRVFSFRSHRGFAVKSPFVKRRGFFPLSESSGMRYGGGAGPSSRRSRAMTSPSAIFMRSMVTGVSSSRMRCGDPEALLSPERLDGR